MTKDSIEKLTTELLNKYNLNDWSFSTFNRITNIAQCNGTTKTIYLSTFYFDMSDEDIKDTILHEIAHALVGNREGHNWIWKNKCIEIGCAPERIYKGNYNFKHTYKFKGVCPNCGKESFKNKRVRCSCGICCPGKFNENYLLIWNNNLIIDKMTTKTKSSKKEEKVEEKSLTTFTVQGTPYGKKNFVRIFGKVPYSSVPLNWLERKIIGSKYPQLENAGILFTIPPIVEGDLGLSEPIEIDISNIKEEYREAYEKVLLRKKEWHTKNNK